jgi:hypothetical protein
MFLGLLDPDPIVRGIDPDLDPSISSSKNSKKNLDSLLLPFWLFIFEKLCKCTFKSNQQKNHFKKISFLLANDESESGSISQRHGSADPDPHQNVMDPHTACNTCNFH